MFLDFRDTSDKSANRIINDIKMKGGRYWSRVQEKQGLTIFRKAAREIPAYQKFLKAHRVNSNKINTWKDFQRVPYTSKINYLTKYKKNRQIWPLSLKSPLIFAGTSGSTGHPQYFPREHRLDWESSIIHEIFLKNNFSGGPVLIIIGFGVGVWIAGLITYKAFETAARRGRYPVSIITPGINKKEIINALRELSPYFKQTFLIGYPPFIKDVIEETETENINLKKLNISLIFAAEQFSENFRDYVSKKAGVKNPFISTMNIYGTAEIGTMAYETPIAIFIRKLCTKDRKLHEHIFGRISKTPTLANYNPLFTSFEGVDGKIIITGNSAIPLIRYNLGDNGGVMSFDEMSYKLQEFGINLKKEFRKAGLVKYWHELPFVYVYERSDMSTTLYGLQVYPEAIREALILDKKLTNALTGKFTLQTKFDKKHDQYLEINLEMKKMKARNPLLKKVALKKIVDSLLKSSSEYRELFRHIGHRALPRLVFWPAEHPTYFKPGIKQRWVAKTP